MPPNNTICGPRAVWQRRGGARLAGVLAVLLVALAAGCDPVDADFFPLAEGNVWLYHWSQVRPKPVTAPVGPAMGELRSGAMWTVLDPPGALAARETAADWMDRGDTAIALQHQSAESSITFGGEYRPGGTVKVSKLNGVLTVQTQGYQAATGDLQLDLPLLTWPVFNGAKWEDHGADNLSPQTLAMCRLIGFETVETPAGRFFECAHIVRMIDPAVDALNTPRYRVQHFWLAPEIGLVKILYESDLGPGLRAELRAFHLNELPPAERARQQAELDRTMDPDHMLTPSQAAGGLTPEEMYRREQWMTHDASHRR